MYFLLAINLSPFRSSARILFITGTHGKKYGDSGLKWHYHLDHSFYKEDCHTVGVLPGPEITKIEQLKMLPMKTWDPKYPDIRKPAVRVEPPPPDSFYADEEMKQMDFRLANMAYYHQQEKKLINDINEASFQFFLHKEIQYHFISVQTRSADSSILLQHERRHGHAAQKYRDHVGDGHFT